MIPLMLTFLRANWLYVVLGIVIAGTLAYIGVLKLSRDYYKDKAATVQINFDAYKAKIKAETEAFEEMAFLSSKEANQKILAQQKIIDEKQASLSKRIRDDKTIRSINVPIESVRMLNESASNSPTTGDPKGTSQETRASETGSPASAQIVNLSTIFSTVVENNINHEKCINQLEGLQEWYNKLRSGSLSHENPS